MAILIDTSFLLAVTYDKDARHLEARQARQNLKEQQIIPLPIVQELFQLIVARRSYSHAVQVFNIIRTSNSYIERLTDADLARMSEIMTQYTDAQLDFADTAIMALSERLNITQVYTFDRRDFGMFRPKHTDYLQLLP
jgi:predicted nucleic acid-binding protein